MDKRKKHKKKSLILKTLIEWMAKDQCIVLNWTVLLSYDETKLYKINVDWLRSIRIVDWMQEVFSIYL